MTITSPASDTVFTIDAAADWPSIAFQTDATGPHTWTWKIVWKTFTQTGTAYTADNQWDAQPAVANLGGTLSVSASSGEDTASTTVILQGTNPVPTDAAAFLATQPGSAGFDKILAHESRFQHFHPATGEPLQSFDNGYGMCQLTTPTPTFAQVWHWKHNVQAGLLLFAAKRAAAVAYLTQDGRTATDDQIKYESVCRWNGGRYHVWDTTAGAWVRDSNILCDPATGNIGWDLTDPANAGKSLAELHQRDSASFNHAPAPGAHWRYFGACYADHLLG